MELTAWTYEQCDADDVCPANVPHVSDFSSQNPSSLKPLLSSAANMAELQTLLPASTPGHCPPPGSEDCLKTHLSMRCYCQS